MKVTWPDNSKARFGKDNLEASHTIGDNPLFSDAGLAELLDRYPREDLGVWAFEAHREGDTPALRGRAPDASGAEIMAAVRQGKVWLNLREINLKLPDLAPIADEIFDSLQASSSRRIIKRDMGLLISSPNVNVHYHLDIPLVALLQLRGRKRVWLYPLDEKHAPGAFIEDMVHMLKEEDLPFENEFDKNATIIDLKPGMGMTWPQACPHRVQNEDCVNVSLSCEYMTMGALINANAIYTNGLMRKQFNLTPRHPGELTPATLGKAAIARAVKLAARKGPRKSPTPVTFELDMDREDCIRPF